MKKNQFRKSLSRKERQQQLDMLHGMRTLGKTNSQAEMLAKLKREMKGARSGTKEEAEEKASSTAGESSGKAESRSNETFTAYKIVKDGDGAAHTVSTTWGGFASSSQAESSSDKTFAAYQLVQGEDGAEHKVSAAWDGFANAGRNNVTQDAARRTIEQHDTSAALELPEPDALADMQELLRTRADEIVAREQQGELRLPFNPLDLALRGSMRQKRTGWALLPMLSGLDKQDKTKHVEKHHGGNRDSNLITLNDGVFKFAYPERAKQGVFDSKSDVDTEQPIDTNVLSTPSIVGINYAYMKALAELLRSEGNYQAAADVMSENVAHPPTTTEFLISLGRPGREEERNKFNEIHEKYKPNGRFIFVMDAAGRFFAGPQELDVVHHSTFLGRGAVAAAGELEIIAGTLVRITNASGHYKPGPAYLWQSVMQLGLQGVNLDGLTVELIDCGELKGSEFLTAFKASAFTFDSDKDKDLVRSYLKRK